MPRTVEPLELEIAQQLPDICSRHGRPAPTHQPFTAVFYDAKPHPRNPRSTPVGYKKISPVSTLVAGTWPICDRCRNTTHRRRRTAAALAGLMSLNVLALITLVVAARTGMKAPDNVVWPFVWAFFPGTIPLGLAVLVLTLKSSAEVAEFRPIDDERFLHVHAHPRFRAALDMNAPR